MRSIELTFDRATEAAFRAEWSVLQEVGLPNLGRHPDASNRPHLTLAAGPALELTDLLRTVFAGAGAPAPAAADTVLPITLRVSDLVLFRAGGDRFVLARPVVITHALLDLHRRVLEAAPGAGEVTQLDRWTPHVTLARRLNAAQVSQALGVLGDPPPPGSGIAARYWNGETKTLTPLAD
jgi:2'-5' RNA ligase